MTHGSLSPAVRSGPGHGRALALAVSLYDAVTYHASAVCDKSLRT